MLKNYRRLLIVCLSCSCLIGAHAATWQVLLEAESFSDTDKGEWRVISGAEALKKAGMADPASGNAAIVFPQHGRIVRNVSVQLPRALKIGEKVKIFCRVAPPMPNADSYWLEVSAGGNGITLMIAPGSRGHTLTDRTYSTRIWRWTE
ncbi:MAG: hypothetical protein JXN60_07350, partial [Lentisphaerae bacterium]|nr:hypothetical protein [Lentisphaerota bacterium]